MITSDQPYIIGETAYNHEGDPAYLYTMIDDIAALGLHAVKFHLLLNPESYMQKRHPLLEKAKKMIFDTRQWNDIFDYAGKKDLEIIALCDDVESLEYIIQKNCGVDAIELHATGLNDYFLLRAASKFDKHVILGIGGSTIDEIDYAVNFFRHEGKNDIILMYGFQSYPTDYSDINLSKLLKIRNMFDLPVGYADHTRFDDPNNEIISVMAAMTGITILEKHYTPDYGKERIDYHAAVGKKQMMRIKELMALALTVYGSGALKMSQAERDYGNIGPMKKAIVAKRFIRKGEKLSLDNLWFKRTENESYIKQSQFLELIGLQAKQDIDIDEIIDFGKVRYTFRKKDVAGFTHLHKDKGEE
ncbi:MAG: N-acetylneuraminate synthase family protein [bacterium]